MKLFTLKEIPDIYSASGNIIKGFKAFATIEVPDADGEFLIQNRIAVKLANQT